MAGKLAEALVRAGVLAADAYDIEEELGLRKDNSVNLTATLSDGGKVNLLAAADQQPITFSRSPRDTNRIAMDRKPVVMIVPGVAVRKNMPNFAY